VSPAKTSEAIEIPFVLRTRVGPGKHLLRIEDRSGRILYCVHSTQCSHLFFNLWVYTVISGLPGRRRFTPHACGARLLLAPATLRGTRFIHYTTCLEIATVVPRALARCGLSKSHHRQAHVARAISAVAPDHRPARVAATGPCRSRTAQLRRACEAHAASAVAPCRFSTAYFVEIGNFATFSEFFAH